ncbi:MAG: imidazole glycerol phosphate synthase subunit HisF [Bacteroidota bacterium]
MYRPRVIPVLLLHQGGLFKTKLFDNPVYIGDPMNAVKIFNDVKADELIFLDINATPLGKEPDFEIIQKISDESGMPFSFGGGLNTLEKIQNAFEAGAEKVVLNTICYKNPQLITEAAQIFGSQAIVASVDVKKVENQYVCFSEGGKKQEEIELLEYLVDLQNAGAGEIMLNSIDRDGMRNGYDIELYEKCANHLSIPLIACGGADDEEDFRKVVIEGKASAAAAGSAFVFIGKNNAVLISYPDPAELLEIFED